MRSNAPIHFRSDRPFLQVQPIHRAQYAEPFLNDVAVTTGLDALSDADWQAYEQTVVARNTVPNRKLGAYAVAARKRRAAEGDAPARHPAMGCPMAAARAATP